MNDTEDKPLDEDIQTAASTETADAAEAEATEAPLTPEAQIEALSAEVNELKDKLLRTLAEAENVRKRSEKQVADARIYAIERFAGDLLPVQTIFPAPLEALDDAAREALSEAGKSLLGGVEMTQKELHASLARNGVVSVNAAPGDVFDPNMHQAVSQIPSDQPSGSIAETFQHGWKIGDRVLRAAMVAVSAGETNQG